MESFVFRTADKKIGYAQLSKSKCLCYIYSSLAPTSICFDYNPLYGGSSVEFDLDHFKKEINRELSNTFWSPEVVDIIKSTFEPGSFFRRINRESEYLSEKNTMMKNVVDEVRSFNILINLMGAVFDVIEPVPFNKKVYGHKVRELLSLACIEVEYLLLMFLRENGCTKDRLSTKDYFKALDVLKLNEYSVKLTMHPEMDTLSPFKSWSEDQPTKSLFWYDSYNSVKHDRGGNFDKASLENAVNAMAAIHILLEAQHGSVIFESSLFKRHESCFTTVEVPDWQLSDIFPPKISVDTDSSDGSKLQVDYSKMDQFFIKR